MLILSSKGRARWNNTRETIYRAFPLLCVFLPLYTFSKPIPCMSLQTHFPYFLEDRVSDGGAPSFCRTKFLSNLFLLVFMLIFHHEDWLETWCGLLPLYSFNSSDDTHFNLPIPHPCPQVILFWLCSLAGGNMILEASTWLSSLLLSLPHRPRLCEGSINCQVLWSLMIGTCKTWARFYYQVSICSHSKMVVLRLSLL